MHIPDGYVSLPVSVAGAAMAATGVAVAARRAAIAVREKISTLPAVVSAYLLVAQLLVVPVGVGNAHLIGTGLATVLVGPAIAIVCVATVVVLQALVFADGGVTAIGLNVVDDGVVPALVAAATVRVGWPVAGRRHGRFAVVAGVAAALAAVAGGLASAGVLVLGGTDVVSRTTIVSTLGGAHLLVAVVEALLTAGIVATVIRLRPDLVAMARSSPRPDGSEGNAADGLGTATRSVDSDHAGSRAVAGRRREAVAIDGVAGCRPAVELVDGDEERPIHVAARTVASNGPDRWDDDDHGARAVRR